MAFDPKRERRVTYKVALDGGQERLRELILYISKRCHNAQRFGAVKLNKILWKADFDAFAARRVPVTGRAYQRLEKGPAPIEMAPLYGEMLRNGLIEMEHVDFGDGVIERRTVPLVEPRMQYFSDDDIRFVDGAIAYYWDKSGTQTSDDSHGVAWQTRFDGDPMPYELAYLSYDQRLTPTQRKRMRDLVVAHGLAHD